MCKKRATMYIQRKGIGSMERLEDGKESRRGSLGRQVTGLRAAVETAWGKVVFDG